MSKRARKSITFRHKITKNHIQAFKLQDFLNKLANSDKKRTAKKLHQLLSSFFNYAVADGTITRSPITKVKLAHYETEHEVPLRREEEYAFLQENKRNSTPTNQAYAFIMYTGLRRCELSSIVIDGEWIKIITAKQRKGMKEKSRSLPISPMLKKVLPLIDIKQIKSLSLNILTRISKTCARIITCAIFATPLLHERKSAAFAAKS